MATHRISCMQMVKPDASGQVYFEPASILRTNDFFDEYALAMNDDDANKVSAYMRFDVPQNYVDNAKFIIVWTAAVTSGNAVFDVEYRAVGGNDTESLDQATAQESLTVTDAAPSAVNERLEAQLTATAANLAAGDTVQVKLSLDGADAACTISEKVQISDVLFEYTDA